MVEQMLCVLSQGIRGGGKGEALSCAARTSGHLSQNLLPADDAEHYVSVSEGSVSSCPEVLLHAGAACVYGGHLPRCLRRQSP